MDIPAGGLAHALSSPLQAAVAEAELALELIASDEVPPPLDLAEAREALVRALGALDAVRPLVRHLRELDRPTEAAAEPFDLAEVTARAAEWVRATGGPDAVITLRAREPCEAVGALGAWTRAITAALRLASRAGAVTAEVCRGDPCHVRIAAVSWPPETRAVLASHDRVAWKMSAADVLTLRPADARRGASP